MSILNPLFEAVAWVLIQIHAGLSVLFGPDSGLTWALSIIILVVGMRVIMLPLFIKQVKSQQRMQAHMPKMREIQKRYKHDKQRQQEEMMKLYKENGINPLGGCLPLVAQLPVFWSLFNVLRAIAEWKGGTPQYNIPIGVIHSALRARVFGAGLADKILFTAPGQHVPFEAKAVILVFVLVSSATTFLTMRQSQKRGMMQQGPVDPDNPAANMQKYMMYIAPLFALSGLYWQFGLVIYWVTTNVWTLVQQHFLFRNLPVIGADADSASAPASGPKATAAKGAPAKGAPAKTGAAKTGAAKTGAAKTGAAKTGAAKTGAAKTGAAKTGAAKTGAAKTGAAKTGAAKTTSAAKTTGTAVKTGTAARTGTAAAKTTGTAGAKTGTAGAKTGTAARTGTASKTGTATKTGTAAKNGAAPKTAAAKSGANGTNGTAVTGKTAKNNEDGSGGRNLLRFGKKAEPEPEPVVETAIQRQQPVRQTRSKRSGKK